MKNCLFEDSNVSFTATLDELPKLGAHGYTIKTRIPKTYVKDMYKMDIIPEHKGVNYWVITVRLNNRTKILLNGRYIYWYQESVFSNVDISKIVINELLIKKYSIRNQEEYKCSCYAKRLSIREKV